MCSSALSRAEQRVADAVLADPAGVFEMSVTQLAGASATSVGTVVRFCQRLGLMGFQDLKMRLAREAGLAANPLPDEVSDGDSAAEVLAKVLAGSAQALADAAQSPVDGEALGQVVEALLSARRIVFAAVGTSAPLAADISYRLTTIGLPATFPADVHVQHVTARMLGPGDLLVARVRLFWSEGVMRRGRGRWRSG
jgi:DNA-binding MurR/RpiR family transcriptional regulator